MAFDGFFVHKHINYLNRVLAGGRIEKVYQLNHTDLFFIIKKQTPFYLAMSIQATHPRILLLEDKPPTLQTPPNFCMLLRKHIQSGVIKSIDQMELERIVTLNISTYNSIGDYVDFKLVFEIMGRHANIMLLDNSDKVIDSLKHVGCSQSIRPMSAGLNYSLPPSKKMNVQSIDQYLFFEHTKALKINVIKWLYTTYQGISPSLARSMLSYAQLKHDVTLNHLDKSQLKALWQSITHHLSHLKENGMWLYYNQKTLSEISAVPLYHLRMFDVIEKNSVNYAQVLIRFYHDKRTTNNISQKAESTLKQIESTISKLSNKINNLQADIHSAKSLDDYKLYGEMLTANLHNVKKGMAYITVDNYYTEESLDIPLDITRTPSENAQRYFKRYHKAKTTLEEANKQKRIALSEIAYLKQTKTLLEQAESVDDINIIRDELAENGFFKKKYRNKKQKNKKLPPYKYHSFEGVEILVGRNNYQNDTLTLKMAKKAHIWLHTKDIAGSHVIICATFEDIDEKTIIEAAEIAAYHSDARHSSQVPVDLTEVKFVKKPRGAKPGMVIYEDNKTIYVNPDEEKIKNLRV